MKLVIDVNLSPDWVSYLSRPDWDIVHWSRVGAPNAPDHVIMAWARENRAVVVTQDIDFSQLLFATQSSGPSVVLLRMENEFDEEARFFVRSAIIEATGALESGALLTISGKRARLRRLPIFT